MLDNIHLARAILSYWLDRAGTLRVVMLGSGNSPYGRLEWDIVRSLVRAHRKCSGAFGETAQCHLAEHGVELCKWTDLHLH